MTKMINEKALPEYIFEQQYDRFVFLEFYQTLYKHEALFSQCLKKAVQPIDGKRNIFINSIGINNSFMDIPLCEVKLDLNLTDDINWSESYFLNNVEKHSLAYYLETEPEFFIHGITDDWAIYCDRALELCIIGLKNKVADDFIMFKDNIDLLGFSNHENLFKWKSFILKDDLKESFKENFKKNYKELL